MMTKTIYEQFEDWYGNNDLAYSNDVKNMAFKAWKAATKNFLSQGEPVAWRQTVHVEVNGFKSIKYFYDNEKIMVDDKPVYLAPPSTEALQKDKAELIEYARNLYSKFDFIKGYAKDLEEAENEARLALAIPQPKCME